MGKVIDLSAEGNGGSGGVSIGFNNVAQNYSALSLIAGIVGQLSYVIDAEGTQWLPSDFGGTYYPNGIYIYDGANWISDRNAISQQLQINIEDIDALELSVAGKLDSVVAGSNITIDNTDPNKPIISSTGGGGGVTNHSQLTLDDGTNPHGTTKADVGLGNSDNTSDANKPISTATQTEIDTKEDSFTKNSAFNKSFGTSAGDVLEGDTTTITIQQANDITSNNSKVGITPTQSSDITTNNSKVTFPEAPNDGQEYVRKSEAWSVSSGGGGGATAPFPLVQARRTTSFSIPTGTATDVNFDSTEVENDNSVIYHDLTNTERIYLVESQYYLGLINFSFDNTANATRTVDVELWLNGLVAISTITVTLTKLADESVTRTLILPPLTANDYIGIRMVASGTGVSLDEKAVVQVIQQKAPKGDTGATGSGANIIVQKENVIVGTVTSTLNFEGNSIDSVVNNGGGKTTITINSEWRPNSIPLGALLTSGASFFLNGGAGVYLSMSGSADDSFFFNDSLNKSGSIYDGSSLAIKLHCRIETNGSGGDDVGLILDYGLFADGDNTTTSTSVAQVNYDVSGEIADEMFDIVLPTMTGVVGADTIMISVTRNSTGAGADSYSGAFEIIGLEFIKL